MAYYRVTAEEYLRGRNVTAPLTNGMWGNLIKLLACINRFREIWDKPITVSSGYRTPEINTQVRGSQNSAHMTCEAIDLHDPTGEMKKFILSNLDILDKLDLYMEDPAHTPTWVHLQTRKPASGKRIFLP